MTTEIQNAILSLLHSRRSGVSVCPSEVARQMCENTDVDWRELMQPVREAAQRLVHSGKLEITQRGVPVNPDEYKGPVRFRLPASE